MSRRIRVYLTLSLRDADLLNDGLELLQAETEYLDRLGHANAGPRLGKMQQRLVELTEAQRPSLLAEGMFDGPPDDYDEGGA
jgi:hypothetical protein